MHDVCLFCDLHGLSMRHGLAMCVATDCGRNTFDTKNTNTNLLVNFANENGLTTAIDEPFSADKPNVMAKWVSTNFNIPSYEIEIGSAYRSWGNGTSDDDLIRANMMYRIILKWLLEISADYGI